MGSLLAAGRVLVLLFGSLMLFAGLGMTVESFSAAGSFDHDVHCARGETADCLERQSGIAQPGGFLDDVTVSYDDGRRTAGVTLLGSEKPPPGTRVWLERWEISGESEVVALYDRDRGRRYRTAYWPERWDASAIGTAIFGLAVLALVLAPHAIRVIRRSRERPVATP